MKQVDVKIGGIYEAKIGSCFAWVEVLSQTSSAYSGRTAFIVRRVFSDGTRGPALSKLRSAAALRPR